MKMPFLLISPKIVPKIQLIKKGGCFEYHAVIADKIKYRYVHTGQIKFNPAVELSYLASEEQKDFLSAMDYAQAAPSLSQAQRIKKLAQEGECTLDAMCEIMNEIKKGELDRVTFKTDSLRKYFPKSYTNKQMEDKIIQLLEQWQKKREKSMER